MRTTSTIMAIMSAAPRLSAGALVNLEEIVFIRLRRTTASALSSRDDEHLTHENGSNEGPPASLRKFGSASLVIRPKHDRLEVALEVLSHQHAGLNEEQHVGLGHLGEARFEQPAQERDIAE